MVLSLFRRATTLVPWAIFDARWSVSSGGEGLNGEVGSEQHLGTMSGPAWLLDDDWMHSDVVCKKFFLVHNSTSFGCFLRVVEPLGPMEPLSPACGNDDPGALRGILGGAHASFQLREAVAKRHDPSGVPMRNAEAIRKRSAAWAFPRPYGLATHAGRRGAPGRSAASGNKRE